MIAVLVLALPLALLGFSGMWAQPYGACIVQNSISYSNGLIPYSTLQFAAYVLCTCSPFLFSSHKSLRTFGTIVVSGMIISASLYVFAFVSVWCFFAAAGSLTIYLHFARAHRERAELLAR